MGSRRAQELFQRKRSPGRAFHESGILSIDFLAGISIFVITLIVAATMISGLLISLQTKKIDFDAVAYRTGVILVEDPGEPNTEFNYDVITMENQWEFIGDIQRDKIRRFGLTLYKSTPRVLAEEKVLSFYNKTKYPRAQFFTLSEYRDRMIPGDYPYNFNISLKIAGGDTYQVGDAFNPNSSFGYIRRVVLIKNQSRADVDMINYPTINPNSNFFYVYLPYNLLFNQSRGPQYWIEPTKENITINLINIGAIKNQSIPTTNITLRSISVTFDGILTNGSEVKDSPLPYDTFFALIDGNQSVPFEFGGTGGPYPVDDTINITFPAGYFIFNKPFAGINGTKINIRYEFSPFTVNISSISNYYEYVPNSERVTPPYLTPGILEVRVW